MWAYEHNMMMMKKDGNQKTWYILCLSQFTQPTDRAKVKSESKYVIGRYKKESLPANGSSSRCRNGPCASSNDLFARSAIPDPNRRSLN